MPTVIAAQFTEAERAVLAIVAGENKSSLDLCCSRITRPYFAQRQLKRRLSAGAKLRCVSAW
jgi:hypothetical protein